MEGHGGDLEFETKKGEEGKGGKNELEHFEVTARVTCETDGRCGAPVGQLVGLLQQPSSLFKMAVPYSDNGTIQKREIRAFQRYTYRPKRTSSELGNAQLLILVLII